MTNTKLRELKKSELDKILEKHELWMCGDESGECANLTEANLKGSDLTRATELESHDGRNKEKE